MENEKQNKQNKVKKVVFEVVYWVALGLTLIFALCIGAHQSKTWDSIENRLSNIEQQINKEESALAREEVRRALPLNDSPVTDLTNTTWLFNERITAFDTISFDFDVYYNSNNTNYFGLYLGYDEDWDFPYILYGYPNPQLRVYDPDDDYWRYGDNYRTITFSGGLDSDHSGLISWLYSNATLQYQPEPEPVGMTFSLPSRYDFRKWLGEVDPLTGCIRYTTSGTTRKVYDLGSLVVSGQTYTYLQISTLSVTNAINIITGYDFQNQCYLAMSGGDYYTGASGYSLVLGIWLTNVSSGDAPLTDKLTLYECPLVGARLQYESGNPISPTDYVPATGFLCSTFELKQTAINWENYLPSDTTYTFPGLGDNLSVYEVLQLDLLNDTYLDFYSISASATGGNVFDLISNAFKVITNLASIQVIPGISIGLLVVLPLTATIIIVVIKLVRK